MAENSKIEWTHHTFNPWRGCTKVSDGCKNCYAETMSKRNPATLGVWGDNGTRVVAAESYWKQPLKWNRDAEKAGERRRVFSASLADVFEDHPAIMPGWRARLGKLILDTPYLDWLLLTKRIENVYRMLPDFWINFTEPYGMPANVWLGTTVENQEQADKRIPELLKIPAAVRFLSCEPLLGAINLCRVSDGNGHFNALSTKHGVGLTAREDWREAIDRQGSYGVAESVDWVIAGGESGPGARPCHPDWIRSLRDQCQAAGVAFHFKQWGGVNKKAAGRILDGREWNEFPKMQGAAIPPATVAI